MATIRLEISESQLLEAIRKLSPSAKQAVLKAIIPEMDRLEELVDYGNQRIREISAQRGIDWDSLNEESRQILIDDLLHEA